MEISNTYYLYLVYLKQEWNIVEKRMYLVPTNPGTSIENWKAHYFEDTSNIKPDSIQNSNLHYDRLLVNNTKIPDLPNINKIQTDVNFSHNMLLIFHS